jgi:isopropylmalate/homocitrate/citramalate synthase
MPRDPPFCIPNQSRVRKINLDRSMLHAIRCREYARGAVRIEICDVGPRDGLQNEATTLSPDVRAELCDRLAAAGVPRVEAVSFVNPKRVPQMAGAEEVMAAIDRRPGTVYAGLVLNERGYERAVAADVDEVHYAFPVTDEFCARNQNTTVAAAIETSAAIVGRAHDDGVRVTVTISVAFGCPFEGAVDPAHVLDVAARVAATRPDEIVLADTIGVGVPSQVETLVAGVAALGVPVGCHFHNTRNTGFANAVAAIGAGATVLDASLGGTGGCPFAPRATGNIATEDLVYLLHGMGHETGIDLDALIEHATWLGERLGQELPGQLHRAGTFAPVAG